MRELNANETPFVSYSSRCVERFLALNECVAVVVFRLELKRAIPKANEFLGSSVWINDPIDQQ